MQLFNKNEGTFTPDALIVSPDFPILTGGIGLKRGQGVLKRGTVIMKGTDKNGYIAGTTVSSVTTKATIFRQYAILPAISTAAPLRLRLTQLSTLTRTS